MPERQLTILGRRTVGDDVALADQVADLHQRTLVDAGVLVRTLELQQVVDVDARTSPALQIFGRPDNDPRGVDLVDHAGTARHDGHAPESRATISSMPVPTSGASACTSGTA